MRETETPRFEPRMTEFRRFQRLFQTAMVEDLLTDASFLCPLMYIMWRISKPSPFKASIAVLRRQCAVSFHEHPEFCESASLEKILKRGVVTGGVRSSKSQQGCNWTASISCCIHAFVMRCLLVIQSTLPVLLLLLVRESNIFDALVVKVNIYVFRKVKAQGIIYDKA